MTEAEAELSGERQSGLRAWWPRVKRWLTWLFLIAVATLLVRYATTVEWTQVWEAIRSYSAGTLLLAVGIAAASSATYACYELVGRKYAGHDLPRLTVAQVAFVSYTFNLNLGALIGGFAFRYRLYSRYGLDSATITRVLGFSVATNWLGYGLLLGLILAFAALPMPPGWEPGEVASRGLGVLMVALVAGYLLLCGFSPRRSWRIRGHDIELPGGAVAMLQIVLSSINWCLMGALLMLLMPAELSYLHVLGVLLISGIVGAATHVPGGLGVVEAVFLAALSSQYPETRLLAALFCYRAVYYLLPLAFALIVYFRLETQAKAQD